MFCPNCGSPAPEGASFCPGCGARLPDPAGLEQLQPQPLCSGCSRTVALVLLFFFGTIGMHRFYVGKIGSGILYVCTCGLFGIGWLVDLILILSGSFTDSGGYPLLKWN